MQCDLPTHKLDLRGAKICNMSELDSQSVTASTCCCFALSLCVFRFVLLCCCIQDLFDTIDLSDNEIQRVQNLPLLKRLESLLLNNNRVTKIDAELGEFVPNLHTLILTGNRLANLADLDALADLPNLTHVSLVHNPATKLKNYREYVIAKLPKLKVLDGKPVTAQVCLRRSFMSRLCPTLTLCC